MKRTHYDKYPEVSVQGFDTHAWQGWKSILAALNTRLSANQKLYWSSIATQVSVYRR